MKKSDRWMPEFDVDAWLSTDFAQARLPHHELWSLLQAPSVSWIERARLP